MFVMYVTRVSPHGFHKKQLTTKVFWTWSHRHLVWVWDCGSTQTWCMHGRTSHSASVASVSHRHFSLRLWYGSCNLAPRGWDVGEGAWEGYVCLTQPGRVWWYKLIVSPPGNYVCVLKRCDLSVWLPQIGKAPILALCHSRSVLYRLFTL